MRARSYVKGLLAVSLAVLVMSGCSAFLVESERAMQVEDIINMTKAGVGPDVIKRQIEVTRSRFKLEPDQIIRLKEESVNDSVIVAMIETETAPEYFGWEYGYSPYEYWFNYYNQWYPTYHYYPYRYPTYYNYPSAFPYTVYRRRDFIGRFYQYAPIYPPSRDYRRREWIYPQDREALEEEK